jgi:hypothetical protein
MSLLTSESTVVAIAYAAAWSLTILSTVVTVSSISDRASGFSTIIHSTLWSTLWSTLDLFHFDILISKTSYSLFLFGSVVCLRQTRGNQRMRSQCAL